MADSVGGHDRRIRTPSLLWSSCGTRAAAYRTGGGLICIDSMQGVSSAARLDLVVEGLSVPLQIRGDCQLEKTQNRRKKPATRDILGFILYLYSI